MLKLFELLKILRDTLVQVSHLELIAAFLPEPNFNLWAPSLQLNAKSN